MNSKKGRGFGFSGFQMTAARPKGHTSNNSVPPPASLHGRPTATQCSVNRQGYSTLTAISEHALAATWGVPRKRAKTEEEYFEEEEEDVPSRASVVATLDYIPAPGSPSRLQQQSTPSGSDDDDGEDPLDAFMAGIEQQIKTENAVPPAAGIRGDIEEEDNEESYYRYMEENPNAGVVEEEGSDAEVEYDADGNPLRPAHRKIVIDPLPPVEHAHITYEPFEKNFYTVHEEIEALSKEKVKEVRATLGIRVSGPASPNPVTSFGHLAFDERLLRAIRKAGFTQPTPIQAQALPAALAGRDLIGVAKTGSGKTAAFLWPMLVHLLDQHELRDGDGPIGLVLAPTRELSLQIYGEARKFGRAYGDVRVVCAYGGGSKWEQHKALEAGAEIVVATPGRLIDLVKIKATNLQRVTFLVLDEADRMFNMGFEPQVRSICNHVRPDRQTLLFSATFKKKVERLARDVLVDPVRIVQGDLGEANTDVSQTVLLLNSAADKWSWLTRSLVQLQSAGSVLVFVTKKADAEAVASQLALQEFPALLLHGDMDQTERNRVITQFKRQEVPVLVATDVAARGLDIPHVRTVVNYDVARDIDTHTHRVGRTGRAGHKGTAYTLITEKDKEFAGHLVRNLEGVNQEVPDYLMDLAMQSSWFRKSRFKGGKGKSVSVGGCGLGFKERACSGKRLGTSTAMPKVSPKSGPATDRLAAMKAAFKNQYQNQFTASSETSWHQVSSSIPPFAAGSSSQKPAQGRRAKQSRWE